MTPPRKRDLIKRAIQHYSCPEGPTWEEAAQQAGLTMADIDLWRRRKEWPDLLAEVTQERLLEGLPVAVSRLVHSAKVDKSSAGVTAARALFDAGRPGPEKQPEGESTGDDTVDIEQLNKDEREMLCRIFGKLRVPG
jgi:hypothetical protein